MPTRVQRVGFPLAFISGYAVSATLIGEPDVGLLTQMKIIDRARHICRPVAILIIVDADTRCGDALTTVYDRLGGDGTTSGIRQQLMAFEQFNELNGVDEKRALAERFDKGD